MDVSASTLIGAHGYCTQVWFQLLRDVFPFVVTAIFVKSTATGRQFCVAQELVNLLLCGRAVPNVFDDDVRLDSGEGNTTLLKGIKSQCDIGLLSLFEYYNLCEVRRDSDQRS